MEGGASEGKEEPQFMPMTRGTEPGEIAQIVLVHGKDIVKAVKILRTHLTGAQRIQIHPAPFRRGTGSRVRRGADMPIPCSG